MSHNKYVSSLTVRLKVSQLLRLFILTSHTLAAMVLLLPMSIGIQPRLLLLMVIITSAVFSNNKYSTQGIIALISHPSDGWFIVDQQGSKQPVQILIDTVIASFFILLVYQDRAGKKQRLLILPDSSEMDSLRRLRVQLRCSATTEITDSL